MLTVFPLSLSKKKDFEASSLDTKIPSTNIGYKMMMKAGWCPGEGLGKHKDGIVEPVRLGETVGNVHTVIVVVFKIDI
jgi:hypothetical protein